MRRDFFKLVKTFGLTSVMLSWMDLSKLGLTPSMEALASTSASTYQKRYKKQVKHKLKFGAAHFSREGLKILPNGSLPFVADLEERTDGEIRVEYVGSNQLCRELDCTKMCIKGDIDFFSASTQNASAAMPYLNVLDFAFLWPSRASQYHFFYHPRSEALLREPVRKLHGIQFLFTHCELRGFMMGLKYQEKPKIMTLKGLKGAKLRATGSQLGRIAMKQMGTFPVPVAWSETIDALKKGTIDGAETWSSAVPYGNWGPVITQDVHCKFFSGNGMSSMNLKRFESLDDGMQQAIMESAYLTQINVQKTNEAKLVSVTGISDPPVPGSYYHEHGIQNCIWAPEELEKAEQVASPQFNPKPWESWRVRLNRMAGNVDIYEELKSIAKEPPPDAVALDVEPRRWWKV